MKTFFFGLIAASAMLVSGAVAQAGFINGGVSFSASTSNNSAGTVLDSRTISNVTYTSGSLDFNETGNGGFVSPPVGWQGFQLTNPMDPSAGAFTLSSGPFGNFTGTLFSDSLDSGIVGGNGNRTIVFQGSFTAGSQFNSSGKQDPTLATLTYVLNQSTTGPNTFFTSSITMTAFGTSAVVPEPASMAIFGLGAIGFAARRFRRK